MGGGSHLPATSGGGGQIRREFFGTVTQGSSYVATAGLEAGTSLRFSEGTHFLIFGNLHIPPQNRIFEDKGVAGCTLQVAGYEFKAKAFSFFWAGPPSHSGKMKINGINRTVTFPTLVNFFERCD
jgi:hypothetical protein